MRSASLLTVITLAALVGCQSTPPPAKGGGGTSTAAPAPQTLTDAQRAATDPCALRMTDVEEAMINFYAINRRLPEQLDELKSYALSGAQLNFTCPVSGRAYVYVPGGLQSAGRPKRILLHDATAAHEGKRWCILLAPLKPGQAAFMEVLPVDDKDFHTYLPISEQSP
jgi:hypothetical protein